MIPDVAAIVLKCMAIYDFATFNKKIPHAIHSIIMLGQD